MTDPVYRLEEVGFAYKGHSPSLVGIRIEIAAGERVVLLGANGSGKSTLLHLLDGLYFPTSGRIAAFGETVTEKALEKSPFGARFRREVGYLFQNSIAQLFNATVEEELAFGPLQLGLSREAIAGRIDETLALMELEPLRARDPQTLSAGEQKRAALASLLVVGPSVLLLDEPTSGLDPRSQSNLLDLLATLHGAGLTLVTATHDLEVARELADRAIVLGEDHTVVADGPASEILGDRALLERVNLVRVGRGLPPR